MCKSRVALELVLGLSCRDSAIFASVDPVLELESKLVELALHPLDQALALESTLVALALPHLPVALALQDLLERPGTFHIQNKRLLL